MAEGGLKDALASVLHWRGRTLALLCLFGLLLFRYLEPVPFETLRTHLFDTLHLLEPRDRQPLPVMIVDIDERSLAKYGQWPWPRNLMARLVDSVAATQPAAIGFDILFAEPDRYSPHRVLKDHDAVHPDLKRHLETLPSNDALLAQSLAKAPTVLGVGALLSEEKTEATRPVAAIPVVERGGKARETMLRFPTAIQSLPELDAAATSRATLNAIPDFDGVVRRVLQQDLDLEREAAQRFEGELSAARSIQLGILPSDFPAYPEHEEFDLFAMLEPAKAVGGDLYDFAMLDDRHLFFIVGDVSGKGIPASLFMALTKALYKSSAMRRQVAIHEIMTEANAEISRENPAMMFVTALSGILDIRTGSIELCNAGHDAPILLSPGKPLGTIATTGGPPLCVLDDFEYPGDSHRLAPGDTIVMYTDGVTEALNPEQELYTAKRLETLLESQPRESDSETIARRIYDDVQSFADSAEASDDVTVLVLRYLGPRQTADS